MPACGIWITLHFLISTYVYGRAVFIDALCLLPHFPPSLSWQLTVSDWYGGIFTRARSIAAPSSAQMRVYSPKLWPKWHLSPLVIFRLGMNNHSSTLSAKPKKIKIQHRSQHPNILATGLRQGFLFVSRDTHCSDRVCNGSVGVGKMSAHSSALHGASTDENKCAHQQVTSPLK